MLLRGVNSSGRMIRSQFSGLRSARFLDTKVTTPLEAVRGTLAPLVASISGSAYGADALFGEQPLPRIESPFPVLYVL